MKAANSSQKITASGERFSQQNILLFSISNYDQANGAFFTHNGLKRFLPPADALTQVPTAIFECQLFGNEFDANITFEFPTGTGNVIVEYAKLTDQKPCN